MSPALADQIDAAAPVATPATGGAAPLAAVVPLTDLYPSPSNPRKHFHGLGDLAESLARKGVEIPLLVRTRETAQGRLEVIDGERRYRAAQQAGLQFVPVILRDGMTDAQVLELQLENAMQRNDLTPLEEARGIKALLKAGKTTPAEIAKSLSRSERFVADRLRLLDLVPELQSLLDQQRITLAHADLLSKLKPEDQRRAVAPGAKRRYGADGRPGGLWDVQGRTLDFGPEEDTPDPYAGLKVAAVKELEAWIATHVRFDLDHAATAAPLEFGRVHGQVVTAAQQPGRAKKVVHITHEYHLADEVKDPAQRVYGPRSWKRADGTVASVQDGRGKWVDAKPCPHSVLGLVVAGPEYGTAFQVCLAKDTCTVHWAAEIREKKQRAKLRAGGQGDQATAREQRARAKEADAAKAREAQRLEANRLYRRVYPDLEKALLEAAPSVSSPEGLAFLWEQLEGRGAKLPKGVTTPDDLMKAWVGELLKREAPETTDRPWTDHAHELRELRQMAKAFGATAGIETLIASAQRALDADAAAAKDGSPTAANKPARTASTKTPAAKKVAKKR